jgi:hypothetical protein
MALGLGMGFDNPLFVALNYYLGSSSLLVKMSRKEQKRSELHFVPPILLAGDLLKLLTSATN